MIAKPVSSVIATRWLMCDCKTYVCFATTGLCVIAEPDSFLLQNILICGFAKTCLVCLLASGGKGYV
jgi:hypothetical protein